MIRHQALFGLLLPHSSAVRHYRFAVGESQMPTLLFSDIQGVRLIESLAVE